jgi:hypothetical protein
MREINWICRRELSVAPVLGDRLNWVATAAALGLGALSAGTSVAGGLLSRNAAKKAARQVKYRRNAEKAWYDKEYNTDYIDTKAGQNLMRRAQEVQDKYVKRAEGAAAVGGGTDASVALAKENANKAVSDTIANVAAQDTARKQRVADQHLANNNVISAQSQQVEQSKADATAGAAQGASNAAASAAILVGLQPNKANAVSDSKLAGKDAAVGNTDVTQQPQSTSSPVDNVPSLDDAVGVSRSKTRYL